ncbi:MAG: glycosyltransferase family 2 protein, partial [Epibacterium sp.]|nr:glycosyltransferase family 2 protein [Epibacterium sp.]NQX75891.1 glycosyltransferase family 2 protein [Epibacterium sp.]
MRRLIERRIAGRRLEGFALLDAVVRNQGEGHLVSLFFDSIVTPDVIVPAAGAELKDVYSVGEATFVSYTLPSDVTALFKIADTEIEPVCVDADLRLFEGRNALAAVRNGESAAIVLDWLTFHAEHHDMNAAVVVDRAKPGTDTRFLAELKAGLETRNLICQVVVLTSDLPLGRRDMPSEAHPFCVPEAPGKDRMEIPPPDPWESPIGTLTIYEILRARFLAEARAVANIDVHDLIVPDGPSVFDATVSAKGGMAPLIGRHCYPWRVRKKGDPIHFADHICVQFDARGGRQRWCIAPSKSPEKSIWRLVRVGGAIPDDTRTMRFYRYMALRHPTPLISKIVPKTSLVEHPPLIAQSKTLWQHKPVRMPKLEIAGAADGRGRCAIVTTMKDEGPFILEWLAYHRAIGFDDFLVYTNECSDGTDTLLELLQSKGIVQHRDNPYRDMGLKPQHAALQSAEQEDVIKEATWITCIDVDEFVNIKCGDGTLDALFKAVPDANLISMTWRLFGNGDVHLFDKGPIIEQFFRCADEFARNPHQAWGFKTLFRNMGIFRKLGVHRPKGLNPQLWEEINWVNGSGTALPREMYRNAWRSTSTTYGYDLVQRNHYAVR